MRIRKSILWMMLAFLILPGLASSVEIVKAKVGVEIIHMKNGANSVKKARAINDLVKEEMLTVVVSPEADSHVYIINSNDEDSVLLNRTPKERFVKRGEKRVFPNVGQLYKLETTRDKEFLTIVVSPGEHVDIKKLFASGTASRKQWGALEKSLIQSSSLLALDDSEKRKKFGGTVRGLAPSIVKHRTATGKGLIVKKYQFNVKN